MSDVSKPSQTYTDRSARKSGRGRTWYLENDTPPSLRGWVAWHMTKGAFYAAVLFFGVVFFIYALRLLSRVLPEDPYAALDAVQRILT